MHRECQTIAISSGKTIIVLIGLSAHFCPTQESDFPSLHSCAALAHSSGRSMKEHPREA